MFLKIMIEMLLFLMYNIKDFEVKNKQENSTKRRDIIEFNS